MNSIDNSKFNIDRFAKSMQKYKEYDTLDDMDQKNLKVNTKKDSVKTSRPKTNASSM